MNLLLDTNISIWLITNDKRFSAQAKYLVENAEKVLISAVGVWEIAIRHPLSKSRNMDIPFSGTEALALFREAGLEILPITAEHAAAVDALPPLHADPFDRMLIAQAISEPLRLLTSDAALKPYSELVELV